METSVTGHCNCGDIKVVLRSLDTVKKLSLCHCLDCRASGGTLFSVNLLIPSIDVTIGGSASPKAYSSKAASGNTSNRYFCPRCGSPVYTTVSENPDFVFVKGGLFRADGHKLPRPSKEQWWRRAETWEHEYAPKSAIAE